MLSVLLVGEIIPVGCTFRTAEIVDGNRPGVIAFVGAIHRSHGDHILDFAGPLGKPSETEGFKRVAVVGGGVGCAIAYPVAKALHRAGAEVDIIAGFRTRDIVMLEEEMKAAGVPDWYIGSCEKIMYMFPKAHAAAYVMMAWRIAYCKLYFPLEYYAAFFSIRADNFSYELMCQGKEALEEVMRQLLTKEQLSKKEQDTLKDMRTVQEMYARGFEFLPIDICKANASKFTIINGKIMPALTSISGLGEKAAQSMADAIRNREVSCVDDLKAKTFVGEKMLNELDRLGIFGDLPKSNQLSLFDMMF